MLFESEALAAFLPLMTYFTTQINQTYCGVASITMVLNALHVHTPISPDHAPYRLFTQSNVLNDLTDEITTPANVASGGMGLETVAELLEVYGVEAEAHRAHTSSVDDFRKRAVDYLGHEGHHVIVNYSRSALQQEGKGHISPLSAYDAESDRFLILDVARYKSPPIWVPTDRLFAAMAEPMGDNKLHTRGFVLVRSP